MGAGRIDRAEEDGRGAGPLRGADFGEIVGRRGPEAVAGAGTVAAVGAPAFRQRRRAGEQHQTWMRRAHPREQLAPRRIGEAVMAKDDPAGLRQPRESGEQAVALPFVGHQPEARERLACVAFAFL